MMLINHTVSRLSLFVVIPILLLGSFIFAQGVSAATYEVTMYQDQLWPCNLNGCTLRSAIREANANPGDDIITFKHDGLYRVLLTSGATDEEYKDFDITDTTGSLRIVGNGSRNVAIDASYLDRAFEVHPGASLILQDMTIQNGRTEFGAGVLNNGDLVLDSVVVARNMAMWSAGVPGVGGGVANTGNLSVSNSMFEYNSAYGDGGAIFNNGGVVDIVASQFEFNNASDDGGAIRGDFGSITITQTDFTSNNATGSGGAVYNEDATLDVAYSGFRMNSAGGGGGLRVGRGGVDVRDSFFQDNVSRLGSGAAITLMSSSSVGNFERVYFDRNISVAKGGAIFSAAELNIDNSVFAHNESLNGGAIYQDIFNQMQVFNSEFRDNVAAGPIGGGAISSASTGSIRDTMFKGNQSVGPGGGILLAGSGRTVLERLVFDANRSRGGGGVQSGAYSSVRIVDSVFVGNSATSSGGGAALSGLSEVENSDFSGNVSGYYGGGLALGNGTHSLSDVTIGGNIAAVSGGGVSTSSLAYVTIDTAAIFGNNAVSNYGGGVYNKNELSITNSEISHNASGQFGGGVHSDVQLVALNTTISGNTAGKLGGGIYNGSNATLSFVTIAENESNLLGIYSGGSGGGYFGHRTSNVDLKAVVMDQNRDGGTGMADCYASSGVVNTLGYSIINEYAGCNVSVVNGDLFGVSANMKSLGHNGGPTKTHALRRSSAAVDMIPAADCTDVSGVVVTADQRSFGRFGVCDAGAFEL
ncbi:hypothetical protein HOI18_01540 [Candidatus Uhrbacteria bacterium]|jgi:predicted outer membrane repeat protein|nr:hypothetical protein [Candidatus Uhrbacteria bacterium]